MLRSKIKALTSFFTAYIPSTKREDPSHFPVNKRGLAIKAVHGWYTNNISAERYREVTLRALGLKCGSAYAVHNPQNRSDDVKIGQHRRRFHAAHEL
jgi:hypothetical protein